MKILVTGGAGFIGSNLIKKLVNEGHIVESIDDYSTGNPANHVKGVEYYCEGLEKLPVRQDTYDIIYHLAAYSRIQPSFNEPDICFSSNVTGTQHVMELARLTNAKVVYAGSSSRHHDPYQSPYAASKYIGEEIVKTYKRTYGMKAEIARFYNVYGPGEIVGDENTHAAVIGIWRSKIWNNDPLPIVGDGKQCRDFTHVDDIVDALWRIGMKDEEHSDAWELGTGRTHAIEDVYQMFRERFGCHFVYIPDQAGNYRRSIADPREAKDRLGWKVEDKLKNYILSL